MLLDLNSLVENYNLDIRGVIHIGAHFGQEIAQYDKIASIKRLVMFEPVPHTYGELVKNTARYKSRFDLHTINCALGANCGKTIMHIEHDNQGQSSSMLKPQIHLTQYPGIKFDSELEVDVYPLDMFEPNGFNMINIDVQGAELHVLVGARNTLKDIDYIMTEVNQAELYQGCTLVHELDAFLTCWGFERAETNWAGGTWGDAFYIKQK